MKRIIAIAILILVLLAGCVTLLGKRKEGVNVRLIIKEADAGEWTSPGMPILTITEDEAREKAREMIDKADAEVEKKLRELEYLRLKIGTFKEEFLRALESYKISVEAIKEPDVGEKTRENNFTPTLIVSERQRA